MFYELIQIVENPDLSDKQKIASLDEIHNEHPEYFSEHHPHSNANLLYYTSLNSGIELASWLIGLFPEFPNEFTHNGNNIVFTAAMNGNFELVEYYLFKFPALLYAQGPQGCNHHGQSILHAAVMGGNDDVFELVMDQLGHDEFTRLIQVIDQFSCTCLHYIDQPSSHAYQHCLKEHFPIKTTDNEGNSLLHIAAGCDHLEFFKALLKLGFDINQRRKNTNDLSPMMVAASHSANHVFQYCLSHGGDLSLTDRDGNQIIHYAAMQNHIEIMQTLLDQKADINARYTDGTTPLLIAARFGLSEMFHFLLEHGAKSKIKDNRDLTLAHYAASGGNMDILSTCRDLSIDLNQAAAGDAHNTPLFYAALSGQRKTFEYLMQNGANCDIWNDAGWHMLHAGAQGGNIYIIDAIQQCGVASDIPQKNSAAYTPLAIAMNNHQYLAFECLLQNSDHVDTICGDGYAPIHLAIKLDNLFFLLLILNRLSNIDIRTADEFADTALMLAARFGLETSFDALLQRSANPLLINHSGWTLLHCASFSGNLHILDRVLEEDIDMNAKAAQDCNQTPIQIAAQRGHFSAFMHLLKAGAKIDSIDDNGWGLQHYAASGGSLPILAKLHALGLDFSLTTHDGETAAQLAAINDYPEAEDYLLEL